MSKNNFLKGAAVLAIAGILIKIIGAFYRIPLTNIMPDEGMGYYQVGYQLYILLVAVSTSGFPTATSKLIAEKRAHGNYKGAHKIFKVSFIGFLIAGILSALVVLFGAGTILDFMDNPNSYYSLIALVPALLFVPIMSAFRGYFQGMQDMVPTAISQLIEQLFRAGFALSLAYLLLGRGVPIAAGGASFGASAGAIAGTIVIIFIYFRNRKTIAKEINSTQGFEEEDVSRIIKDILYIAIPITIGASIVPIINQIDTVLITKILQQIGYTEAEASARLGQLSGNAQTLINLPQVLSVAMAMSLVPSISDAFTRKDYRSIKNTTNSGIRMTLLIGLPCAIGLLILAHPIIDLLYFSKTAVEKAGTSELLAILSISIVFLTLVQSLTAILQGIGKPMKPVKNLAIGAVIKVVLTYTLVMIPSIEAKGAAISTVITYLVASILNLYDVKKYTGVEISLTNTILRPVISGAIMGVVVKIAYVYGAMIIGSKLATLVSIGIGAVVYGISLLLIGAVTSEDFEMLPKGKVIAKKLKSIGLLRN